jgi:hypothetical protein
MGIHDYYYASKISDLNLWLVHYKLFLTSKRRSLHCWEQTFRPHLQALFPELSSGRK